MNSEKKTDERDRGLKLSKLGALMSAAFAIPGVLPATALAQVKVEPEMRVAYDTYRDYQRDGADRMTVNSPSVWLRAPISEKVSVQGTFVLDSVSGASPYYFSSVSTASIRDSRKASEINVDYATERFALTVGGAFSTEDDYDSRSGKFEGRTWSEDKNTTFAAGFSYTDDDIGSTLDPMLRESRISEGYLLGVTQVLTPRSVVQMNLTYNSGDGYFTDPYKTYDSRPRSREQWAWLTRYVLYLPEMEAALHADYRYYQDTFGINSHMVEISIYQPILSTWIVRPSIRYYSQEKASFFADTYPPEEPGSGFYSADQRLGEFGALTAGLKVIKDFGSGFSGQISFDYIEQQPGWKFGGVRDTRGIQPFYAQMVTVGMIKKF